MPSMGWVGLDVHARETCAAVFDQDSGEVRTQRLVGRTAEVMAWLETLERPWRAVYEAGPTGYGLARQAAERDLEVAVCAPGLIARRPNDHIKTDPRDALRLARLLAAGELALVRVPAPARKPTGPGGGSCRARSGPARGGALPLSPADGDTAPLTVTYGNPAHGGASAAT
jgi:hypothetical protein